MENQYLNLAKDILKNGTKKSDRTGTGTISVFGRQLDMDISERFPLLTTKKINFNNIAHELIWYIRGNTNIKYLKDNGVNIWNSWANNEDVGYLYPRLMRSYPATNGTIGIKRIPKKEHKNYDKECVSGISIDMKHLANDALINCARNIKECMFLYPHMSIYYTWKDLLLNAANDESVKIYSKWLDFNNFMEYVLDSPNGFELCYGYDGVQYVLHTYLKNSLYHPKFCNIIKKHDVNKVYKYSEYVEIPSQNIDQLKYVIDEIKNNPDSRRIFMNMWHPSLMPDTSIAPKDNVKLGRQSLTPCHVSCQFYVEDDRLSCHMYQRSADLFLGVPYNIATYSLLTYVIAKIAGLKPHRFIHSFGDVHIYNNHVECFEEQFRRTPRKLPEVNIKDIDDINFITIDDFEIKNYNPHPFIKGEVSV